MFAFPIPMKTNEMIQKRISKTRKPSESDLATWYVSLSKNLMSILLKGFKSWTDAVGDLKKYLIWSFEAELEFINVILFAVMSNSAKYSKFTLRIRVY